MAIDLKALGMTEEELVKLAKKDADRKVKEKKYWIRQSLLIKKAIAAGIKVTDAEVEAEYAKK